MHLGPSLEDVLYGADDIGDGEGDSQVHRSGVSGDRRVNFASTLDHTGSEAGTRIGDVATHLSLEIDKFAYQNRENRQHDRRNNGRQGNSTYWLLIGR